MRKRIARVLITTDKHVRDTDFKNIKGYRKALRQNIRDQREYCLQNGVTHVIDTGDIADRGFKEISQAYSWEVEFRKWREHCELYSVIGNHLYLEMDSNPELYWIQPSPYIKPKDKEYVPPDEPLFITTDKLILGTFMFSFHHYSKTNKNYFVDRPPGITHHHAVYHDDTIIPSNIQKDYHITRNISSEYLQSVYANVDSATVGHIHKNYGLVMMYVNGREVPLDIPGSNCITNVGSKDMHNEVALPQYDIYDDGTFEKSYVTFSLHLEMMRFYHPKKHDIPKEIIGVDSELTDQNNTAVDTARELLIKTTAFKLTPETFLSNLGYKSKGIELYQIASRNELTVATAIQNIMKADTEESNTNDLV